ncbi:hypothetical protein PHMEG_00031714 [Phytophthora megakarya]|uniref:Ankyrin repeat-containing domain n=1 Tax=Phytophthora megakarya TaxID=4795 RepID=A0A225UYR8_9STRA|nr:hypothetical protein PHMEG_00031714 [Phytophthora megakarya]
MIIARKVVRRLQWITPQMLALSISFCSCILLAVKVVHRMLLMMHHQMIFTSGCKSITRTSILNKIYVTFSFDAKPAPLLAATLLFGAKEQFVDLPHVVREVSLYLDSSVELPLDEACKQGSIKLLSRIWKSSKIFVDSESDEESDAPFALGRFLRTDKHYKQFKFTQSLYEAIDSKNLEMVEWLVDKFQGCVVRKKVVSEACIIGSVDMLQLFYDNDNSLVDENARRSGVGVQVDWHPKNMVKAWLLTHGATWPNDPRGYFVGLHLARWGRLDVLKWLDKKKQLGVALGMLAQAAEGGHLDVVRWLIDRDTRNSRDGSRSRMTDLGGQASLAIHGAAVNGHLAVAKYLRAQAKPPSTFQYVLTRYESLLGGVRFNGSALISGNTMVEAARMGYLEIAKYWDNPEVDLFNYGETRPWQGLAETVAMDAADLNGHLEVVKAFALPTNSLQECDQKPKGDETKPKSIPRCTTNAMDYAAGNGHLLVVQWLHQNRSEGCNTSAMDYAARLSAVVARKSFRGCTTAAIDGAVETGYIEVVKWLRYNRTEGCTKKAMDNALRRGFLEIAKWLHEYHTEGCSPEVLLAGSTDKLNTVKWLRTIRPIVCTGAVDRAPKWVTCKF